MGNIAYLFVIIILLSTFLLKNSLLLRSYQFDVRVSRLVKYLFLVYVVL